MGMGDAKKQYQPHRELIRDDVTGRRFADVSVRRCPCPAVINKYGTGGVCNVSVYTCKKCKFAVRMDFFEGYKCRYGLEQGVQS